MRLVGSLLVMLAAVCFGFIAAFGQWQPAMVTLASIVIAVPLGIAGGLLLGLAGYRFSDFLKAGWPVTLTAIAAGLAAIGLVWI